MKNNELKVMDQVLTLRETAQLLRLPEGSVRLGRHDTGTLTPIRFNDSQNAPLFYLREDVYSILRRRAQIIEQIKKRGRK